MCVRVYLRTSTTNKYGREECVDELRRKYSLRSGLANLPVDQFIVVGLLESSDLVQLIVDRFLPLLDRRRQPVCDDNTHARTDTDRPHTWSYVAANKCRPSAKDQAHNTHTTIRPHYTSRRSAVSHREKSSVLWLWCGCSVDVECLIAGRRLTGSCGPPQL